MLRRLILSAVLSLLLSSQLLAGDVEIVRSRYVNAKAGVIQSTGRVGQRLTLRLFHDVEITAVLDRVEMDSLNGMD